MEAVAVVAMRAARAAVNFMSLGRWRRRRSGVGNRRRRGRRRRSSVRDRGARVPK